MKLEIPFSPGLEFVEGEAEGEKEVAEEAVDGGDFVEAHFIDQFLEDDGVFGEEGDAPLPVIEADGAGDDLLDASGVASAD